MTSLFGSIEVMDKYSLQLAVAILLVIACSFTSAVSWTPCDVGCPVAVGSGCKCRNICEYIKCNQASVHKFPSFQPTATILNITSIMIEWYYFKEIPSRAFDMGSNVTVKQIIVTDVYTLERIEARAFSGLTSLQHLTLKHVPKLHTIDSMAFFGLSLGGLEIYDSGLSEFPTDSLMQIRGLSSIAIYHSKNHISSLPKGTFSNLSGLLDYLDLSSNGISNISSNAFFELKNLTTLDLSSNYISRIHGGTFGDLESLSSLLLESNPITTIDAHAFNGTDLPKLSSLSLSVSNVTMIEPEAFGTLPELKDIVIRLPGDDYSQGNCVKSISINCTLFPQLQYLELHGAVCADILQPLSTCIKDLTISSNYENAWSEPVCLSQLENLSNLQNLTLTNLKFIISFNLKGLKGLSSLYEVLHPDEPTRICDEALASTPYLRTLSLQSLQERHYIPKAVENMENLDNLRLPASTKIICNCSSYWLYNFTTSHGTDISSWLCMNQTEYWNVSQFLDKMHASGGCQWSPPDFQEWEYSTCSKLCSPDSTNSTIFTSSTTPMHSSTSPSSGTSLSKKPSQSPTSPSSQRSSSTQKAKVANETILYSVLGTLAFVLLLSLGVGYYWYKRFRRLRRVKVEQLALQSHQDTSDHWEVPRSFLQLFDDKLGSGAFGVVIKGKRLGEPPGAIPSTVKVIRESAEMEGIVAVKMLPSHANSAAKYQFLQEIETMKSLGQHPHLVSIIACITMSEPVCLIMDYCSDGDLLTFLKARKPSSENADQKSLSLKDLLSFAWQVADGMSFLSSKGYAHRDLAARNVLIHNNNIAKVSDFGLCRLTDKDTASYVTRGGRLPLRWLAPECLQDYKFSIASDVWAFGILLFEIISLGSTPYEGMHLSEIESFLAEGKRMGQLEGCPDDLYQMMLHCWEEVPGDRPGFPELRDQLVEMLEKEVHESYDYLTLIPETSCVDEE